MYRRELLFKFNTALDKACNICKKAHSYNEEAALEFGKAYAYAEVLCDTALRIEVDEAIDAAKRGDLWHK